MTTKNAIRYALVKLMDENETSGKELAEAVGVSKQAVSAWRTGKSSIDIENVPAICDYFGISIAEFFDFTKELDEKDRVLSNQERAVIEDLREMNDEYRNVIAGIISSISRKDIGSKINAFKDLSELEFLIIDEIEASKKELIG